MRAPVAVDPRQQAMRTCVVCWTTELATVAEWARRGGRCARCDETRAQLKGKR